MKKLLGSLAAALTNAANGNNKPKTDMTFGVHNHYNNNSDRIGDFKHPAPSALDIYLYGGDSGNNSELNVRVTDQGIVVFNLGKKLSLQQKVFLASALDGVLKDKFGVGLSFATCGFSDCVRGNDLQRYYNAMKQINPNMITIFTSYKLSQDDKWIGRPPDLKVDHIVDQYARNPDTATIITGIVNPNGCGKTLPPNGWIAFEASLEDLFAEAIAISSAKAKTDAFVEEKTIAYANKALAFQSPSSGLGPILKPDPK